MTPALQMGKLWQEAKAFPAVQKILGITVSNNYFNFFFLFLKVHVEGIRVIENKADIVWAVNRFC